MALDSPDRHMQTRGGGRKICAFLRTSFMDDPLLVLHLSLKRFINFPNALYKVFSCINVWAFLRNSCDLISLTDRPTFKLGVRCFQYQQHRLLEIFTLPRMLTHNMIHPFMTPTRRGRGHAQGHWSTCKRHSTND